MERDHVNTIGWLDDICTWVGDFQRGLSHDVWFPPSLSAAHAGIPAVRTFTHGWDTSQR